MNRFFADLHIHIGRTSKGNPVKISASDQLTFHNIARESSDRKGIEMIGIIDCHAPTVQADIESCLDQGMMEEIEGGGIRYRDTLIILGSEIEVHDPGTGPAHLLVYMPDLSAMKQLTKLLKPRMTNIELSSQRLYLPARILQDEAVALGGIVVPAHIFTPHKGLYGSSVTRMSGLLEQDQVAAVELGLSADTLMAGFMTELDRFTLVTNSDAHSLGKIAREYNEFRMHEPSFEELRKALQGVDGRGVAANYGLNPHLGKYHRTYCLSCENIASVPEPSVERCPYCGGTKIVCGVMDRILAIADRNEPAPPESRPPYRYQIPLEYIPGLGPKTFNKLLDAFQTEMAVIHRASYDELADVAGERIAGFIVQAREGTLQVATGGGGRYGKVKS